MRRDFMKTGIAIVGFACLLSGCGASTNAYGGGSSSPVHPAWWRSAPDSVAKNVYVTQESGSGAARLFAFGPQNKNNSAPICTMSAPNGVVDIGADASGDVYVPDIARGNVRIIAPNCGAVIGRIHDQFGGPIGVVVQPPAIYIADGSGVDVCSRSGCTSHLTDPSIVQLSSAAADGLGDVWGAGYGSSGISLVVWQNAKMPGHVVSGYIESDTPGDIMFDNTGDLVTVDSHFGQAYRFKCQLVYFACTQLVKINLHGASNFGALNGANSDIQVTDFQNSSVDVYSYPNFRYEYSYDAGFNGDAVEGIAQVP